MTKILVIEDENAILENVLEVLELEGFEAVGAPNGMVGVQMAQAERPDLIVCDIMMPQLDGYGVLLKLRSNPATSLIPFIFLTAKVERRDQRYGMVLGADDYLTKPFTNTELLDAIRGRLERQAVIEQEYEQKLDTLRGNIFHMLPHELRTPLVSILGYSEMLIYDIDTLDPPQVVNMATTIFSAGKRLHRLIENFLIYAQIEIVRSDTERLQNLREMCIEDPVKMLRYEVQTQAESYRRENDLVLELTPVPAVRVTLDNLKKIVTEVVDNAFKFSDDGSPVRVCAVPNHQSYEIVVTDEGRGMTAEQIANIGAGMQFERRLYEQQGTGLGLTIARQLAKLHGGTLHIESVPQKQTVVTVRLPLPDA